MPFFVLAASFALAGCNGDDAEDGSDDGSAKTVVIDFNGLLTEAESEFVGQTSSLPDAWSYYYPDTFSDPEGWCVFTHYVPTWGSYFGGGFTYTNKTDIETASYTNSSAITGTGVNGDTYLVCNADTYEGNTWVERYAEITFAQQVAVKSAYFTNSTYAYLAMRDGGYNKVFGSDDWYSVTVRGWLDGTQTGEVEVFLAEGGVLVDTWELYDLTPLGTVDMLDFYFNSSDVGSWGMNNPAYFCMDGLTFEVD